MTVFSARVSYALSAVFELALRYASKSPLQIKEIALAHGIPQQFLEQLLIVLKRGGLVSSVRGVNGGYLLAKDPGHIRVAEVITCLEGEMAIGKRPEKAPALERFWKGAESNFRALFNVSLQELVLEHGRVHQSYVYSI